MFNYIFKTILSFIQTRASYTNLEDFIVAHKPQTPDDIDRLEREFYRQQSNIYSSSIYYN